jgi:hypothetical protein
VKNLIREVCRKSSFDYVRIKEAIHIDGYGRSAVIDDSTLEQLQDEQVVEIEFAPVLFPIVENRNLANLSRCFQLRLYY